MEARGESQVLVGRTPVPLSTYLADHMPVLLLKVLDPKPEAVSGDLYFEVHEEKQEVYVVTHIDPTAWPSGVGGIRFGMNQKLRARYSDAQAFRAGYLEAVQAYQDIRTQIDKQGKNIPAAVEEAARATMNAFAEIRELQIGDVIKVPTWTPHSLLHGVRVVEFQTPTYERLIISFAQEVLTQDHWNSEQAIAHMHIDEPAVETFEQVAKGIERVARFDDFNVWRVDLADAVSFTLPADVPYAVCMGLTGEVYVGSEAIAAEQACFIPQLGISNTKITGSGKILVAAPDL